MKNIILLFFVVVGKIEAYRILAIISMPLKSHFMAAKPLFIELAAKGHSLTIIGNYPNTEPVANYTDIDLGKGDITARGGYFADLNFYDNVPSSVFALHNFYVHISTAKHIENDCIHLFKNDEARNVARNEKFDVIFVEQFMSDCALGFIGAYQIQGPIIGITSHVMLPWSYNKMGLPFREALDAFYFTNGGQNPGFIHKLLAFIENSYFNTILKWQLNKVILKVIADYAPDTEVNLDEVEKKMTMLFAYQSFPLTGSRLLTPQILEIAGLHIGKPKEVPKDIDTFMADPKDGVILVSLGSNLKFNTMSEEKLKAFHSVFDMLHYKIIWKWENATSADSTDKILKRSWLPQLDILCDPRVVAFVSHGGMLSTSEAVHCGKPMVVLPFFGDQFSNAAAIRQAGIGIDLYYMDLDHFTLAYALRQVLSEKMQNRVKQLSTFWHDRPASVMDSAIYWTEHVARHRGASPPAAPARETSFFDSQMFDVYLFLVATLVILYKIIAMLVSILVKLFSSVTKIKAD